jgi:hypothetical protein
MVFEEQIGKKWKCSYKCAFADGTMLLLIELKFNMGMLNNDNFRDIVAMVCAEAEGNVSNFPSLVFFFFKLLAVSSHNVSSELGNVPVHVILTDSTVWEFFYFEFSKMYVWRGYALQRDGYRSANAHGVTMPVSETDDGYLLDLKIGNIPRVIFFFPNMNELRRRFLIHSSTHMSMHSRQHSQIFRKLSPMLPTSPFTSPFLRRRI